MKCVTPLRVVLALLLLAIVALLVHEWGRCAPKRPPVERTDIWIEQPDVTPWTQIQGP